MTELDYKLHKNEIGYSIYTKHEHPIITHSANPIVHSKDEDTGNMDHQEIPEIIKQSLYLLQSAQHAESEEQSYALYKVYEKMMENEASQIEQEVVNLVYNYSDITDGEEVPEMTEFKDWCITTSDPTEIIENQFATKAVREYVESAKAEDKSNAGGSRSEN